MVVTQELKYKLPTNSDEMDRLSVQHRMWCLLIGGLYPVHMNASIASLIARPSPSILDLGCGSGIWAFDMARAFPRSKVIGFDLTEQTYTGAPSNFEFVQGDVTQGLPAAFVNQFDLVHCRCVAQHVPDPQALVYELSNCLKPGGVLILADGDWVAFDERRQPLTPFKWDPTISELEQAGNDQGRSWYAGWLDMFGRLTRSERYQPIDTLVRNSSQFTSIESNHYLSPINWDGDGMENGAEIGQIMNRNMREFFQGGVSVMLENGTPPGMIDIWRGKFDGELEARLYNVWHLTTAQKV